MLITISKRGKKPNKGESLISSDKPELQWIVVEKSRRNVTLELKEPAIKELVSPFPVYENESPSEEVITTIVQSIVDGSRQMQIDKINKKVEEHYRHQKELANRRKKLTPPSKSLLSFLMLGQMFDEAHRQSKK